MNENWNPNNSPPQLSDTDAELLSAYMDEMLNAVERAALEKRLETDAFLRRELAATRQTVEWLNTMPRLKAPRNFTLSEAEVKPVPPKIMVMPRRNTWQIAGAAAAVFVTLLVGTVFIIQQMGSSSPVAGGADVALSLTDERAVLNAQSPVVAASSIMMPTMMPTMAFDTSTTANEVEENSADSVGGDDNVTFGGEVADESQESQADMDFYASETASTKIDDITVLGYDATATALSQPYNSSSGGGNPTSMAGSTGGTLSEAPTGGMAADGTNSRSMPSDTTEAVEAGFEPPLAPTMPAESPAPESIALSVMQEEVTEEVVTVLVAPSTSEGESEESEASIDSAEMANIEVANDPSDNFNIILRQLIERLKAIVQE